MTDLQKKISYFLSLCLDPHIKNQTEFCDSMAEMIIKSVLDENRKKL